MQVVRAIGGRAPLHLTSVGKLFLAADEAARVRAYAMRTGLSGHTQNSITDLELERELLLVRQQACARDNKELELGVRCIVAGHLRRNGTARRRLVAIRTRGPSVGRLAQATEPYGARNFAFAGVSPGTGGCRGAAGTTGTARAP